MMRLPAELPSGVTLGYFIHGLFYGAQTVRRRGI
jgi:hypothetical protein